MARDQRSVNAPIGRKQAIGPGRTGSDLVTELPIFLFFLQSCIDQANITFTKATYSTHKKEKKKSDSSPFSPLIYYWVHKSFRTEA